MKAPLVFATAVFTFFLLPDLAESTPSSPSILTDSSLPANTTGRSSNSPTPSRYSFRSTPTQAPTSLASERLEREGTAALAEVSAEFSRVFQLQEKVPVRLRFVARHIFQEEVDAAGWMAAVYQRGEILIPIERAIRLDAAGLRRTLRHEYVHAVTAMLSQGRTPLWLDEGLAQFFEGAESQTATESLLELHDTPGFVGIGELQKDDASLVHLSTAQVKAAYGLMHFAVRSLVFRYGLPCVARYLRSLAANPDTEAQQLFAAAFKASFTEFETDLQVQLLRRTKSSHLVAPILAARSSAK